MTDVDMPAPLPEDWLPEPAREAGDEDVWDARARRIVAAAGPRLRELRRGGRGADDSGAATPLLWLGAGGRWRAAAALAAAALLSLALTRPPPGSASRGSPALGAIVSDGQPAGLWRAAGEEAHPVLALIALEEETP